MTILAPFVKIPIIDQAFENFGKEHPYITGLGTIIFCAWLITDNFKDGHSDKWIRRVDYIKGVLVVGLGFFHIIKPTF